LVRKEPSVVERETAKRILEIMLAREKDVIDSRNINGETPLHCACRHKSFSFVQWLVEKGANCTITDKYVLFVVFIIIIYYFPINVNISFIDHLLFFTSI